MDKEFEEIACQEGKIVLGLSATPWPRVINYQSRYFYQFLVSSSFVSSGFFYEIPKRLFLDMKSDILIYSKFYLAAQEKLQSTFGPGHPSPTTPRQDEFREFVDKFMNGKISVSFERSVCQILWNPPHISKEKISDLESFLKSLVIFNSKSKPYYSFKYIDSETESKEKIVSYIKNNFVDWAI